MTDLNLVTLHVELLPARTTMVLELLGALGGGGNSIASGTAMGATDGLTGEEANGQSVAVANGGAGADAVSTG